MSSPLSEPPVSGPVIPVPGRECGDCAMCCVLPAIAELKKPEGQWCVHCSTHAGCDSYDIRPAACRGYECYFKLSTLGEEWRPNKAGLMVSVFDKGKLMVISVDPERPDAWQREPFFSTFPRWAERVKVYVQINRHTFVIFPDHIDDLGEVQKDELIGIIEQKTPEGVITRRAIKANKNGVPIPVILPP